MRSTRRRSGRVCGPRWSSSRPATAKCCCCGMQDCRTTRSLPRPDWRAAPWGRPWRARGADWWRRSQRESGMSISHVDDGQLHAYLDGELPQAEAWRLEAHLGECPACRGRLEEQRALIARAGELLTLAAPPARDVPPLPRSEEHTSELQSPCNLVCRLLLEKKKTHNRLDTHRRNTYAYAQPP